jgi:hypothetical protein
MRRAAAAGLLLTLALAGCGTPSHDVFAVERAGTIPGAKLRMIVNDGGSVTCDGGKAIAISSDELLEARDIGRELEEPAQRGLRLAPAAGSVLRYTVRTGEGTVRFGDNSRGKPAVLDRLVFYVRRLAKERCGRPR